MFIVAALLVVAVGCKNRSNEVVAPSTTLEIDTTEISIGYEAQIVEIEVLCNEEFDVKEEVFWLAVVNVREGDRSVVVLNALENDSDEARSADVVIVAGEETRTVTITQSGKVAVSMEVAIGHRNTSMVSPKWGGEVVTGSINWGDGTVEEYAEGAAHDYANDKDHTAIFTMSGATSFEIEKIGAMESLTIAVD